MDPGLFRHLIEGISPRPDTWSERSIQDHDLGNFVAFTDEEIATIVAFLHEERETVILVVPDEMDTQEEEDINWDTENDAGRSDYHPG
jgi:aromatic ring-cleaving dioxygenase